MDLREVRAAYDAWATTYDADVNPTRDLDAVVLRIQPLPLTGAMVVELGCGTGKNTHWLAEQASQVTAIDFSARMLSLARQRIVAENVQFVTADLLQPWPIPTDSSDLVIGDLVFEHIPNLEPVFREAFRVLRPGGGMFVCELHPYCQLQGSQARFVNASTRTEWRIPAFKHEVADFVNAAISAGLRIVHLGEYRDPTAEPVTTPRLLSVTYAKD